MLPSFLDLFKPKQKNVLPLSRVDLDDDFVYVDGKSDQEEIDSVVILQNPEPENPPEILKQGNEATAIAVIPKSTRQLRWEQRYHKIFAKVADESGQIIDIRYVNNGAQLAFWNSKINGQTNVFRSHSEDEIIMPNRGAIKIVK